MKRTLILIFGVMLFAVSCKKETLNPREVYRADDLCIEFTDFSDSRCPHNADCIWAGEAEVFLKATSGDISVDFSLKGLG